MDTSPNWVEETRAFQWFHLAVDLKSSVWSLLWQLREAAGCEHSTQVSPCALPMSSCLTGSLQRLCQPDMARARCLPVYAQAHRTFGCCRLHSSSVWGHAYQFPFSVWGEAGLADRVETAISRQHRQMLFFLHRLVISPEFGENVSGSCASCAQKSHLERSCPCAESSVRMLSESIQLGHRWACIILPCTPLYCLSGDCPSVTLSEENHVYIPLLFQKSFIGITVCFNSENTIKLPILFT